MTRLLPFMVVDLDLLVLKHDFKRAVELVDVLHGCGEGEGGS